MSIPDTPATRKLLTSGTATVTERLKQANAILAVWARGYTLEYDRGMWLLWKDWKGVDRRKRWVATSRGSDFGRGNFGFGGTTHGMVMELSRWVRGLPVRSRRIWSGNAECLRLATEFGWPESPPCVICGKVLTGRYDHYDKKYVTPGPGCVGGDNPVCDAIRSKWR